MTGSKGLGAGARTDLDCPTCGAKTRTLSVRASREPGAEPGFPPIGRLCLERGHIMLDQPPRQIPRCAHDDQVVYVRGDPPARKRESWGMRCKQCGRVKKNA